MGRFELKSELQNVACYVYLSCKAKGYRSAVTKAKREFGAKGGLLL